MESGLIVIPPKWEEANGTASRRKCRILLIPDTALKLLPLYEAESVVSYGLSEKSTITPSSISDFETVVSIQRELPTIDGELLEQQEIALRRPENMAIERFLAVVGALLITGVRPEQLEKFF